MFWLLLIFNFIHGTLSDVPYNAITRAGQICPSITIYDSMLEMEGHRGAVKTRMIQDLSALS